MKKFLPAIVLASIVWACSPNPDKVYNPEPFWASLQVTQDTFMADLLTYVYRKPERASRESKWNPEFRQHYVKAIPNFVLIYHHNDGEFHYFYMLRPARNVDGHKRGMSGRFKLDQGKIIYYEELFNTPMIPNEKVYELGAEIFPHVAKNKGELGPFLGDVEKIEFPDDRTFYDMEIHEWRYK